MSRKSALGAILPLLLWASPARATVMVEVPIEDMVHAADAIAMGEVSRLGTQLVYREDGQVEPWTVITIRVERWLKSSGSATVTLYERGGDFQGGGMRVAGTPEYRVGERVVVFLRVDEHGRFRTYGMAQGRFVIRAGVADVPTTVERDFRDLAFASWSSAGMSVAPAQSSPLPLALLLERIRYVLEVSR